MNGDVPMSAAGQQERPAGYDASPQQPGSEILRRCGKGDRAAFQQLVTQLMRPAHCHALALVSRVLQEVSLEDREIICMKDMHDLAYKEIAVLLGIPIGKVMSRLYAARGRFKQKMQESGYESAHTTESEYEQ